MTILSYPIRSYPIRSDPIRSDPIRSYQILSDPIQSDPIRSNPIQSNQIRSDRILSDPIRSKRSQAELSQARASEDTFKQYYLSLTTTSVGRIPLLFRNRMARERYRGITEEMSKDSRASVVAGDGMITTWAERGNSMVSA